MTELHYLLNVIPAAVYTCDLSGRLTYYNQRTVELWGREPAHGDTDERFCGSYKLYRPDGSFMPHEQCPMAQVVAGRITVVQDAEAYRQTTLAAASRDVRIRQAEAAAQEVRLNAEAAAAQTRIQAQAQAEALKVQAEA